MPDLQDCKRKATEIKVQVKSLQRDNQQED
jgi:hypothetical protein